MSTLTNPTFWKRWLGFGLWNPDRGPQPVQPVSGGMNSSGVVLTDDRVMQVATAFACIRLIAQISAMLPLQVYRRGPDGSREEAPEYWLSKLLREPNPIMTGRDVRTAWGASLAGWGNAYNWKVNSASGKVVQLWPHKPAFMKVERPALDRVIYRYTETGGRNVETEYQHDDVLHMKGFTLDGITGLSPLAQARQALGLAVAAEDFAGGYYRNGGKPSGVLMVDKLLTDEQADRLHKKYAGMGEGTGGANKLWVLEAFAKYQQITIPPEDAQMLQTRQHQVADIARFFGMPLFLLNETEKSTSWGSGLEQQNLAFLAYCLQPYLNSIETGINRWLIPENERETYFAEHNVDGLLRADSKTRAELYKILVENGIMDRNEVRRKENLKPRPEAGQLTAQVNLAPLDKLGEKPEPAAPPPEPAVEVEEMRSALGRVELRLASLSAVQPVINVSTPPVEIHAAPVHVDVKVERQKGGLKRTVKRLEDGTYEVEDDAS